MNARTSSCLRGLMSSFAPVMLVLSGLVSHAALAQSSDASAGTALRLGTVRAPFQVAPTYGVTHATNSVAMADINQDGKLDLITADATTGRIAAHLGSGSGTFTSGPEFVCGCHPSAVAVADLGDGGTSVLLADGVDGKVRVLSVSSDGQFALRQSYATGVASTLLVTGSFGGHGGADVAVAGIKSNTLAVLLNDGKGNLGKPVTMALGKAPVSLASGDFNGDGRADLAAGNGDGTVTVLLGAGNGGFHALTDVTAGRGLLTSVAIGDFDHDGKMDLAVTDASSNAVSVLLGKGDGSFDAGHRYAVGNGPVTATVSDVNGDGVADLVTVNEASNSFTVLAGNGDGTFQESASFVVDKGPQAAVIGDFDGDGHADVAVIHGASKAISVAMGNGDGSFRAGRVYGSELEPLAAIAADLNGDKRTDLVVTNYCGSDAGCAKGGSVSVFLADSNGGYKLAHSYTVGAGPVTAALMDVDGDGTPDIVVLNRVDKTVSLLSGRGDGSFLQGSTLSLTDAPVAAAVGDFNGDGKLDLAVLGDCGAKSCAQAGSVEVLLGQGHGTFRSGGSYAVGYGPVAIAAGDLNNDKSVDLVVANRCGADASCKSAGTATVLLSAASGKFVAAGATTGSIAIGNSPSGLALGDLAGRGVLDLVVSRAGDNTLATLPGRGDGTFGSPVSYAVGSGPGAISLGDFDGDGTMDVAVANTNDATVSVLFGSGSGKMGSAAVMPVGAGPAGLLTVTAASGQPSALVTANANAASTQPGSEITVLTRLHPEVGGATSPTVSVALTTGTASATYGTPLVFTATVTGTAGSTQPTGTVTFKDGATVLTCTGGSTLTQNGTTDSTTTCAISTLSVASHNITASYVAAAADPTYIDAGPSTAITETITKATPTVAVALTTGTSPAAYGASLQFTATVTGTSGSTQPTGSVTFKDGATALTCTGGGDNTLTANGTTDSTATCTLSTLAVGSHSITATYVPAGDVNYSAAGPSAGASETISKVVPTIAVALTTGTSTAAYGTSLQFTATVTGTSGSTQPTGSVTFTDGAATLTCTGGGDNTLTANGTTNSTATCTLNTLAGGSHSIAATYVPGGDVNYSAAGPSTAITETISKAVPTIAVALTTGTPSATYGTSLKFTSTVTGTSGSTQPTGSVTFKDGATALTCTGGSDNTLTANGTTDSTATCTLNTLGVGSHNITATYVPGADVNYSAAGPSTALSQTITQAAATLTLGTSPSPSTVDQSVTITATVTTSATTPTNPAGTVAITINGAASADCPSKAIDASGKATCTTQALVAPADIIAATYTDTNFTASPASITQTVSKVAAQTALLSSNPTAQVNQTVTFTATVTPPTGLGTATLPTGAVTFKQGATTLCSAPLSGSPATATCAHAFGAIVASPGTAITATYAGDSNFTAGTGASVNQTVNAANTVTTITGSTPNPSNVNQAVTFIATLAGNPAGSVVPQSGSVVFTDTTNSTTICTETVTAGAVPNCVFTFTTSGTHNITATFTSTDTNFNSSPASAALPQVVNSSGTTISLTASPTASTVDQSVTFSSVVSSSSAGAAQPKGTVVYSDNTTTLCTVTLTGGNVPDCTVKLLTAATHPIVAKYTSSDGNFQSGTSSPLNFVVSQGTPTLALAAAPSSSTVNQQVKFTLTITPPFTGTTVPTGTASFSYAPNGSTTVLCSNAAVSTTANVTTATCTAPLTASGTFVVTATYSGDTNFTAGTPATESQVVAASGVTVNVASISPATPTVNQTATFTGTVTSTVAGGTLPGGTITFFDITGTPAVLCTTGPAVSGVFPSCTGAFSAQGTRMVRATYNGDANFSKTNSGTTNQAVAPAGTVAAVASANPNPSIVNQPVTMTATVTANPTGAVIPRSGTMTFTDTSASPVVSLCSVAVTNGTVQTCSYSFLTAGTHNITATFTSTDPNFSNSAASGTFAQVVNPSTTKVTITNDAAGTLFVNQAVTFGSTVTSTTSGTAIPQGTVVYRDTSTTPATSLCSVTLTATGTVPTCTVPSATIGPMTAGAHAVVAVFTPSNTDFNAATSTPSTVTIAQNKPAVTVALSGSPSAVTVDQPVTYMATITENPAVTTAGNLSTTYATGTVTFTFVQAGASPTSPCTASAISQSGSTTSAICTFSFPTSATSQQYTVTATYNGDSNFITNSGNVAQSVGQTSTSLAFSAPDPATAAVNQPVTFTATVSKPSAATGLTLPSGSVTFSDTTRATPVTLCTAAVTQSTGIASCPGALRYAGSHTITASYNGDANFSVSSGTQTETVAPSAPVIKLTSASSTVVATQTMNFSAVVSPAITGTGAQPPTGTIVFTSSDGATNNCSPVVTSPGDGTITNSCQFAFLPTTSGNVTVTASFVSADGNFTSGTAAIVETVQNFQVAFNPSQQITVTQGYQNNTDPFLAQTVTVNATPASGFSDSLTISCTVQNAGTTSPLTCATASDTLAGNGSSSVAFTVKATPTTPVEAYTVVLTATDNKFPGLSQQTSIPVLVLAASGTVSLAPGSAATQSVSFNTAPPSGGTTAATLTTFACGNITKVGGGTVGSGQITCTGPASPVTITGDATPVAITITVNGTTTSMLMSKPGNGGIVAAAAFWGLPVIGLLAWVARKSSARKDLLRYLGIALLIVGMSYGIGCGGHFTRPPTVTGGPPVGSYLVQVVATDSNGINHYAIVPLVVN